MDESIVVIDSGCKCTEFCCEHMMSVPPRPIKKTTIQQLGDEVYATCVKYGMDPDEAAMLASQAEATIETCQSTKLETPTVDLP